MEKEYTFLQKLIASFTNTNVEWYYATDIEKMLITYKNLSTEDHSR